jgi:DNA-binding NtrC family response regulator
MKQIMSLLIVDDDADDRKLFIDAAREVDHSIQCIEVNNGEQALEMLKNREGILPHFIFLDLRMPRFSGKRCLLEIKNDDRLKHIPVIIYTTSKDVNESKELKKMGAFYFISKPNNADEIFYLISFVLEEHANSLRRDGGN